jgi:hypothetical protein
MTATKNHSLPYNRVLEQKTYNGSVVTVIRLIGTNITTHVRLYKDEQLSNMIEIESFVDSIYVDDK